MRSINVILAASLAAGLTAGTAQARDYSDIRLGVDIPYEPFMYRQPDGELTGFEIELGNAVCDYLEVNCTWVEQDWDGIIPGLLARNYDAIMSSMSITEERAERVLFSEPYYTTPSAWITANDRDIDIEDRASLEGLVVGVQRATLQDNYVTELYGDVLEIRRYTSANDVVTDMRAGRLDLTFMDYPVAESTIAIDTVGSDFKRISGFIKEPEHIFGKGVGVAFRPRDEALAERFNEALAALKEDGTYDALMERYFNYDVKL
ncbi:MAG: transporter substrate-binding domain-containing protein [Halomonas sp.]|jgi:arginine/ornithine transport system substrate-binding protein|uniref:Transporter substrate-binding domain-containing protein n=1 Tax=Billgrantia tianxiuensis TaxID=2497861 RepID=A0A6I6SVF1_9GAMM|nr:MULTISPECIES: transporter substrate-binding domain-containing protein [Halomonas]MCE8033632.1 transporter substrate-binding domain-containing protein [Halomonas sp. MCCC 1A11057]MDX5432722.1 transporter substrate-binding domain-containing protein [Halomonas sp.]QHC51223.1 transporter substrate-binding domain-containing protein [Halomonas tianxiuensis]